MIYFSTSPK